MSDGPRIIVAKLDYQLFLHPFVTTREDEKTLQGGWRAGTSGHLFRPGLIWRSSTKDCDTADFSLDLCFPVSYSFYGINMSYLTSPQTLSTPCLKTLTASYLQPCTPMNRINVTLDYNFPPHGKWSVKKSPYTSSIMPSLGPTLYCLELYVHFRFSKELFCFCFIMSAPWRTRAFTSS